MLDPTVTVDSNGGMTIKNATISLLHGQSLVHHYGKYYITGTGVLPVVQPSPVTSNVLYEDTCNEILTAEDNNMAKKCSQRPKRRCVYCEKDFSKLKDHLLTVHKDKPEVYEIIFFITIQKS